jgi:acetyltransferase-like isoleucine patch superfamily enzyme
VGSGAFVAAGSTVTGDVPADAWPWPAPRRTGRLGKEAQGEGKLYPVRILRMEQKKRG